MAETIEFTGLSCDINLPLEWSLLPDPDGLSSAVERANQNCLKIILGLDEGLHEVADESAELNHDLQRMDFKINIILEMVAQLASQNSQIPASVDIKLSSTLVQWPVPTNPPEQGQVVQAKIYMDARFPFPVVIIGNVISVTPMESGYCVIVEHAQANACSLELLEKYIFRCHRRQIARMKSGTGA